MYEWVTAAQGLVFVRIATPTQGETDWSVLLANAINEGIDGYLGGSIFPTVYETYAEISAAAVRAFGYGWKYREAPFGEAQFAMTASETFGSAVKLAKDWIDPIKPILNRYRDVTLMVG
jgi:hypothetical protein